MKNNTQFKNMYYILDGREIKPVNDVIEWAKMFESFDRLIKITHVCEVEISTVFLGLNHSWTDGPPLLFETMIFGGDSDGYQERYSTYDEAEKGHDIIVQKLIKGEPL